MIEENGDASIRRTDRIGPYLANTLLPDIEGRIFGIEYHWFAHLSHRAWGEEARAEGHLRMSVVKTMGLAAHPPRTRDEAERKAAFLTLVGIRLIAHLGGWIHRDHRGALPMLAAVVDVEVRRWTLSRPEAGGGEPDMLPPERDPSPALARALTGDAVPRALTDVVAEAYALSADARVLAAASDWPMVACLSDHVRAHLLHSLAIPATSVKELQLKRSTIEDWADYLRPTDLTGPMLEAVIPAEGRRLGQTIEVQALLGSTSPNETF
jgi:hypothetical protein